MAGEIYFRTDANPIIGSGHLVRCRLLARHLKQHGAEVHFLTSSTPTFLQCQLRDEGFDVINVPPAEIADTGTMFLSASTKADLLVIDSNDPEYYTLSFQQQIRKTGLRLMMITFWHECPFAADIVHNQNSLALEYEYSVEPYTTLLLGPRYAILADAFQHLGEEGQDISQQVKILLVSFGGADRTNQTQKVISALAAMKAAPRRIIVVAGALYAYIDELRTLLSKESQLNTELHINTSEMPELMAQSDLAITSGGLTVWELACVGVPNIVISTSEPERQTGLLLDERGLCCYLGHHDQVSQKQITHAVTALMDDQERRREMALTGKRLVDGRGIHRVVDHMMAVLRGEPEHAWQG